MRKFIISGEKYTGEAVLVFDQDNVLKIIDLIGTNMSEDNCKWLFDKMLPIKLPDFLKYMEARKGVLVREDSYEVPFEMFWKDYDKKINRKRCEVLWNRLGKNKQIQAWVGIAKYNKFLKKEHWRAKADPETYLKKEMWENEWK